MGLANTPRRSRRSWGTATPVSVRDALLLSTRDLSVVSEISSIGEPHDPEEEQRRLRRTPSIAWEFPVDDFLPKKPDPAVVNTRSKKKSNKDPRSKRNRRSRQQWTDPEAAEKVTSFRSKTKSSIENGKAKKPVVAKHDIKRLLSTNRARQKVLRSRNEDFHKTVHLMEANCSVFRKATLPEEHLSEEEACIVEVQRGAFDRWEKAIEVAKAALEEVMEAEKLLGFASEFEQLKGMINTQTQEWDVGIDKYIDLYKNLQKAYPETVPIRRSKIHRQLSHPNDKRESKVRLDPPQMHPVHSRHQSLEDKKESTSSIPSSPPKEMGSQRFDPSYILSLGRRFAHSAESWFLKLVHRLVGRDVGYSVYCREDCYRLMESLSKLQIWLWNAKGTTRIARHEVLLTRLRDTVIRWSSTMFELPLAKTSA